MRKIRTLIVVAVVTCLGVFGVAEAQALEWAGNGYYLSSGQNGFLNHSVYLYASNGYGEGVASCAGIRGYGNGCAGPNEISSYVLAGDVYSEPYLHNHSTYGGYFKGYYFS
jgi:hypothetical protein